MRAAVVVLGDLPRSPRIVLQAAALDRAGVDVDLVGFADPGWRPPGTSPRLRVWPLPSGTEGPANPSPFSVRTLKRGLTLLFRLTHLLAFALPRPDLILVQNPPGVPTLAVAWAVARLRRARFAIDWHNLTWSMLALRLGPTHPLVTTTSAYERFLATRADVNLFVSAAMRDELTRTWGARGHVFRDRPAAAFTPLDDESRRAARDAFLARFTEGDGPAALVVSATSWTADEDFSLLFDALEEFERSATSSPPPVLLVVVITGRGPLRDSFERRIAEAAFTHVSVHTAWLDAGEYPRLLAAADLGLCLHRSSSGLDLPMKALDMLGAGLPVCALNYGPCLGELIVDGSNGLLFLTSADLAAVLTSLCSASAGPRLDALRAHVRQHPLEDWGTAWCNEAQHLLIEQDPGVQHR